MHQDMEGYQFYSQYHQDEYIYELFFKNKYNGIFVDIGAHDGITYSNTFFFEKHLGWSGICVEPIPELFERLRTNRKCVCVQGCIFDKSETAPFLKLGGRLEMLSGIIENYDPLHRKIIQEELDSCEIRSEVIQVQCYKLTDLLLDNHLHRVDFLSIDTEGGELGILQSIDFERIDIDVIQVENNYQSPFQQFLEPMGYKKIISVGVDEIYQKS